MAGEAGFITMVGFCWIKLRIGSTEDDECGLCWLADAGVDIACGVRLNGCLPAGMK